MSKYIRDLTLDEAVKTLKETLRVAHEAVDDGEIKAISVMINLPKVGFVPPEGDRSSIKDWKLPENLTLEKAQWMLYGVRAVIVRRNARGSWCAAGSQLALEEIGLKPIRYVRSDEEGDRPKNREGWDV